MAGKKNDDNALIGIGAFLFGAALAQPSKENAQKLHQYKSNEFLFNQFKLYNRDFQNYLQDRKLFDDFKNEQLIKNKRWKSLGDLKINQRVFDDQNISNFFNEAVNMFLGGFFRSSCISCAIVIEALLKGKFGTKRLIDLIEEAKNKNMINESDKHYLNGIRLDRNDFVHTIGQEINENDAKIVILITSKIINKIV